MSLLDEATVARMSGDSKRHRVLRQEAFENERQAAELLTDAYEYEPTRSILFRSAATLALDCADYGETNRLAAAGLAGNPPMAVAQELRDVQAQALNPPAPVVTSASG